MDQFSNWKEIQPSELRHIYDSGYGELSILIYVSYFNPCPAEPGCTLYLQTVQVQISWHLQKPTDLDLHCLLLSM